MPVRVLLQRVQSASLLLDNKDAWGHIQRGVLMYVSVLKEATEEEVKKCVQQLFNVQLYEDEETKKPTALAQQTGCDIMIIPQASLGGKCKQKNVQYHALVSKEKGAELYDVFVKAVHEVKNEKSNVVAGTYGNTQGLKFDASFGPYSHCFDF